MYKISYQITGKVNINYVSECPNSVERLFKKVTKISYSVPYSCYVTNVIMATEIVGKKKKKKKTLQQIA